MKSILFSLLLISLGASAASMDDAMAKVHGTCTPEICPPGTKVISDAAPGDTGAARTPDGKSYDLLQMKGVGFTVMDDANADNHQSEAKVSTESGAVYFIQWMFLKKK